jgi:hypothetical protein
MKNNLIKLFSLFFLFLDFSILQAEELAPSILDPKAIEKKRKEDRPVDEKKGRWSFQWGYNRASFTQSDINFKGPGYQFTLKDVVAKDKPEAFSPEIYLNPNQFEIPQYNYKFSYFISDRLNISFGHDHMKYVMVRGQESSIYGYISPLAIRRAQLNPSVESFPFLYLFPERYKLYEGYHGGERVQLTPDLIKFDHTDGLNYLFVDLGFNYPLWISENKENSISFISSVSGGPVVCRSDVRLFGEGKNNLFNVCGYGVAGTVGTRVDFSKSYFWELVGKSGYIDLPDISTTGRSKDQASQNFGFLEMIVSAGAMFN